MAWTDEPQQLVMLRAPPIALFLFRFQLVPGFCCSRFTAESPAAHRTEKACTEGFIRRVCKLLDNNTSTIFDMKSGEDCTGA